MWQEQINSCVVNPIEVTNVELIRKLLEVKISDEQLRNGNLSDGIEVEVIGTKPFTVNAFWVVKIHDLHREIEKDWITMRDLLWDRKFLRNPDDKSDYKPSLQQSEPQIFHQTNESVNVRIKPPQPINSNLMTQTPRDFYPIVIIVSCHEEEPERRANDIAANIHIIHVKDDIVPVRNHVIKNYTKQVDGKILDISQLYTEETIACMICYEDADPQTGLRLFCLLPCRHSPICSECLRRIRECPKCRNFIQSVFDINATMNPIASQDNQQGAPINDDDDDHNRRRKPGFFSSLKKTLFGI